MAADALAIAAARAPAGPGVYFMIGDDGELLYVGKAAVLRKRLKDHVLAAAAPTGARAAALVERVAAVRWEECVDEAEALVREADLIVLLRPPFNASHTEQDPHLYVRVDVDAVGGSVVLELTRRLDGPGRVYGAFPHLAKGSYSRPAKAVKAGYTAMLRLLWGAQRGSTASVIPSRIGGASPPVVHRTPLVEELRPALHDYLSGRSRRMVDLLASTLDANDDLSEPVRSSLGRDVAPARDFFALGPRRVRALRLRHGQPPGAVSADLMAQLVAGDLPIRRL